MSRSDAWIGKREGRHDAERLVAGRGNYTNNISSEGAGHVAFLRSPYPHARIKTIACGSARGAPGVIAVFTGKDIAAACKPWQIQLTLLPDHNAPMQFPLAIDEVCWQGEAVVAVVALTRAQAEDALELIEIEWLELPAVVGIESAADGAQLTNTAKPSNLGLDRSMSTGDPATAFQDAAYVVEDDFIFERQTAVTLEPRAVLADFDPRSRRLTIYHSHQAPHQMRDIFATQLGLPLTHVRVVAPDVGGSFGMKLSAYPDEIAVAAIAVITGRPVKFVADRLESFVSDNHAREAKVKGRLALDADGHLTGMEVAVLSGFGAYPAYPRGSAGEAMQAMSMCGAPYRLTNFKGEARGYFQNKVPSGILRGVGQPIACAVTEQLMDLAARKMQMDPAELRRRNYTDTVNGDARSAGGLILSQLSLDECHARLLDFMKYDELRRRQAELRGQKIYRGIGLATFVEQTAVGPSLYGPMGVRVSANEACRLTVEADGTVRCETSVTDQGQGTKMALTQIIAQELGVGLDQIEIVSGDTACTPMGGGAWASRGTALGGEAALQASRRLKQNILLIAASMLQAEASTLRMEDGAVVNAAGLARMTMADVAETTFYRSNTIPLDTVPSLDVVESFTPRTLPYVCANGIQAAHVEVDTELGAIRVLDFWVAEDCGKVINPLLVDEQLRGGVVQGIGSALYEQCIYNDEAQFENGSLADYLVPMAAEMPDIHIAHVETPTRVTSLGARGVGEAGAVAAAAAIRTAVNDALSPLGATARSQPFTPEKILDCIALARGESRLDAPS